MSQNDNKDLGSFIIDIHRMLKSNRFDKKMFHYDVNEHCKQVLRFYVGVFHLFRARKVCSPETISVISAVDFFFFSFID